MSEQRQDNKVVKMKHINAYLREDGKKFLSVELENGTVTFINYAILKYAMDNIKTVATKKASE